MLKKGDRVRFLNAVGGGVVSSVVDARTVTVTDESGFDVPVPVRECVLVEQVSDENNLKMKSAAPRVERPLVAPVAEPEPEPETAGEIAGGDELRVSLAFVPSDAKRLTEATFDCFLVNDCNFHLYYTVAARADDGRFSLVESGLLQRNMTFLLKTFGQSQIASLDRLTVQLLAFKDDRPYEPVAPVAQTFRLKPINFLKLHSFTENDYFDEPAMMFSVAPAEEIYDFSDVDFHKISAKKEARPTRHAAKPAKQPETVEVDLHINQLLDTTAGMSAGDMLEYQLKVAEETLVKYRNERGRKIVFIHGKGNGTLRSELLKRLRRDHPTYTCQDASFREYGFGATLVTIR